MLELFFDTFPFVLLMSLFCAFIVSAVARSVLSDEGFEKYMGVIIFLATFVGIYYNLFQEIL